MKELEVVLISESAEMPEYATHGSAGADLKAAMEEPVFLYPGDTKLVPTGLLMAIPETHFGMVVPRSGLGHKHGIVLGNGTGIIDSDYRGEVMVSLHNRSENPYKVNPGDRVAQILFVPVTQMMFKEVHKLNTTIRNGAGFGSTGE